MRRGLRGGHHRGRGDARGEAQRPGDVPRVEEKKKKRWKTGLFWEEDAATEVIRYSDVMSNMLSLFVSLLFPSPPSLSAHSLYQMANTTVFGHDINVEGKASLIRSAQG